MNLYDALREEGSTSYLIMCYGIFPLQHMDSAYQHLRVNLSSKARLYRLHDEAWPNAVVLSEVHLEESSMSVSTVIELMREVYITPGCLAALCMLDGAFGAFDDIFSQDVADQIYAFCIRPDEPVIVFDGGVRSSDQWKSIIAQQRDKVL